MAAIKKHLVNVEFVERKLEQRQITIFAPDNVPDDDICNMAEAQMLEGFTPTYKAAVELTGTKILRPKA